MDIFDDFGKEPSQLTGQAPPTDIDELLGSKAAKKKTTVDDLIGVKKEVASSISEEIPIPLVKEEKVETVSEATKEVSRRSIRRSPRPRRVDSPKVENDVDTPEVSPNSPQPSIVQPKKSRRRQRRSREPIAIEAPAFTIEIGTQDTKEKPKVHNQVKTLQEILLEESGMEDEFSKIDEPKKRLGTKIGRKAGYEERQGDESLARVSERKDVYRTEEDNPFSPVLPNDLSHYTTENHVARFTVIGVSLFILMGLISAAVVFLLFGKIF